MKKILFIDNSKPIRLLLYNLFKKDYDVVTVPDSATALYQISEVGKPDVIIIDPSEATNSKDYQFMQYIKNSIVFKHIPIVVLTKDAGNIESLVPKETISMYMEKPFDPVKLRGCIINLLAS